MKVLTAAEMRDVDRRTVELGISEPILMENAGHRVVEFLAERFGPLASQRILVLCGKGNNGGDGMVVARQLWTRFHPAALWVVATDPDDDSDPARMLRAAHCPIEAALRPEMQTATIVVDALLGTGITGPARGKALDFIRAVNGGFPLAKVVAVDIPSGLPSDGEPPAGEYVRADATITFTALKVSHALPPNCDRMGEVRIGAIGSPDSLYDTARLHVTEPGDFRALTGPREPDSNKGRYGHVLVVGGAEGKAGAAEMAGIAALRAGAGLATVACSESKLAFPELMTASLPADESALASLLERKNVLAIGPGLGMGDESLNLIQMALEAADSNVVMDADALNLLARSDWQHEAAFCVITPHPGEMSRLCGRTIAEIQADRLGTARTYAAEHNCAVVLKGHRTVVALPDGRAWINPTGSPAMSTGGTGDILTGMIAGMLAQFPDKPLESVLAGVYLHGLSGQLAAACLGEQPVIATDLLRFLPEALGECSRD